MWSAPAAVECRFFALFPAGGREPKSEHFGKPSIAGLENFLFGISCGIIKPENMAEYSGRCSPSKFTIQYSNGKLTNNFWEKLCP